MKTLKKNIGLLLLMMGVSLLGFAQTKTENSYRIKTIKIDNGKKWVLDTTFDSKEDMDLYMSTMDIKVPESTPDHDHKIIIEHREDIDIDLDSLREELGNVEKVIEYNITELKDIDMNEVIVEIEDAQMELMNVQDLLDHHQVELEKLSIDLDSLLKAEGVEKGEAHVRVFMLTDSSSDDVIVKKRKKITNIEKVIGSNTMSMDIQPNPAQDEVTINLKALDQDNFDLDGSVDIRVMTITGELVQELQESMDGGSVHLSTDALAKGTYIVQVTSQGRSVGKKLIVE